MTAVLPHSASALAAAVGTAAALALVLRGDGAPAARLQRLGELSGPAAGEGRERGGRLGRLGRLGRRGADARRVLPGVTAAPVEPVAVVAITLVVAALAGPVPGVLCGLAWLVGRRAVVRARLRRTAEARGAAVVEVSAVLADELRAGAAPLEALRTVGTLDGPLADRLGALVRAAEYGGDVPAGLRAVAALDGAEGLRAVAACWAACTESGAGLAEVMHGVARTLRERQRLRAEARAHLASARTSAWLLAGLPLVGLLLGEGIGARPLTVLLGSPLGQVALVVAFGLEVAGLAWMGALLRRAEPP